MVWGLPVFTIDILAFVPQWHQGLYFGMEEIDIKCL